MSRLFWRRRIKSFLALSIFVEGTSTAQQHLSFRLAYPCGHRQVRENSAPPPNLSAEAASIARRRRGAFARRTRKRVIFERIASTDQCPLDDHGCSRDDHFYSR